MRFIALFFILTLPHLVHALGRGVKCDTNFDEPHIKVDLENDGAYQGLTQKGIELIQESREALDSRLKIFAQRVLGMPTIHHAAMVARLTNFHMFLYGPKGGAKTMFVEEMFKADHAIDKDAFRLQLHQMMNEQPLVGGQTLESAKNVDYEIKTEGTMVESKLASLDELDKGNPILYGPLLSILNEGKVLAGQKEIEALVQTVFATSNANLPEFLEILENSDLKSTAQAFLNRFQFKVMVYNWLPKEQQKILDEAKRQKSYVESVAKSYPELKKKSKYFVEYDKVEWRKLSELAEQVFEITPDLQAVYLDFIEKYKISVSERVKESQKDFMSNKLERGYPYFPAADLSERLRGQFYDIIKASAMIDFLKSDLSSAENLAKITQERIKLGPSSLWRAYLGATTLTQGDVKLALRIEGEKPVISIDFDFDLVAQKKLARDLREEGMFEDIAFEQTTFKRLLENELASAQDLYSNVAKFALKPDKLKESDDFELRLFLASGGEIEHIDAK